jgi:AAA15 family ATPase/GTPase
MIESLRVANFRCYSSLKLTGLKRINIVVGANSSGKTTLLESLFMVAGASAPNAAFQLRALRQLGGQLQFVSDPSSYQGLWEDLFHWYKLDQIISIEATGSSQDSRSLLVYYDDSSNQLLPFGSQSVPSAFFPQINFEWKRGNENAVLVKPKITPKGLEFDGASTEYFPLILFGPHASNTPDENARRFSALSRDGKSDSVIDALRREFSFLDSLSIEYASNMPSVFATVKGNSKKLPVGLLSDGINKLLSILLGIASFSRGTVLIDQIEDGFYFDRLRSIWEIIYSFAVLHNVQIFVTTHSRECLESMLPVVKAHVTDFCLLRAKRDKSSCSIQQFDGEGLLAALEKRGEIR